ncbi:hypothetical protein [Streptomyces sp. SID13031]|uniref:hypothetical protein n=1 Tax=Streptomyces sp. SID13031 TaxID=2706046 RepID=UPI0013CD00E4|nr:hypothetical protein [Streptomyces sp. SID13031]NEA32888.1 hypothetical protein [Streptomyces sp. SID13031]
MKRWIRRTLPLIVLGILGVGALPAHAGGPTSVLLSVPSAGKVVATGYDDKIYGELQELLDTTPAPGSPAEKTERANGRYVRATWMIHDMTPWRLDMIYPDAPGGPWIATTENASGGALPYDPVWHRAKDGAQLIKLLDSLGLLNADSADGGTFGGPTALPQAPQTPAEVAAVDDTPTATVLKAEQKPLLGWRWSIPGFLVGAAAAYLFLRLLPRRRWQLIDEE